MKFTYNELKKFLNTKLSAKEISIELTKLGLEFSEYTDRSEDLSIFTVAHITEAIPHPNADKLRVCTVDNGTTKLQIVCGAPNARAGIKVVLAPVGAIIPNGKFAIKSSEIRGVKSEGMMCSSTELLVGTDSDGIIELPEDAIIGSSILPYLGLDDVTLEVEVTPNRADCFGIYGIARDLAAKGLGILNEIVIPEIKQSFDCSVKPEITSDTKLFAIREIKNLKNAESPAWLKNFLRNIGQEPISAIVDITNYFSISYGRPLHAYDRSKIGNKLVAYDLEAEVSFEALNGKTYQLSSPDLVISDEKNVLCVAGVIGGELSKCTENTTHIVLESNVFDKVAVTKSGRKHNIITDSRARFERGIDHNKTLDFLDLATTMIIDICGGEASKVSYAGSPTEEDRIIEFDISLLEKRIGITKTKEEILVILKSLGFKIEDKGNNLKLIVPSWRPDINLPEVVAEEIARISCFDNIPMNPLKHENNFSRVLTQEQRKLEDIRRNAASLGYNEVITYSFMPSKKLEGFVDFDANMQIENPISSDLDYMRPSIIPNLLEAASNNIKRSVANIGLFEVGPVFKDQSEEGEQQVLTAIATGNITDKSHCDSQRQVDIFDIKSHLEQIIRDVGFNPDRLQIDSNGAPKYYHPTRSASLKMGKQLIAYFGELHPSSLESFDIKAKTCGFELFLENLPLSRIKFGRKTPIILSQYQKVFRDFAFVMDDEKSAGEILRIISSLDDLIKDVEIFDLYKGTNLGEGKKSIAIKVAIQADDRTLTDQELELLSTKIISAAKVKLGAELRA